jgi:hypothetical protein
MVPEDFFVFGLISLLLWFANLLRRAAEEWVRVMQERDENEARRAVSLLLSALLIAGVVWKIN